METPQYLTQPDPERYYIRKRQLASEEITPAVSTGRVLFKRCLNVALPPVTPFLLPDEEVSTETVKHSGKALTFLLEMEKDTINAQDFAKFIGLSNSKRKESKFSKQTLEKRENEIRRTTSMTSFGARKKTKN